MSDLDKKILEQLSEEDRVLFEEQSRELGLFDTVGAAFKGKRKQLNLLGLAFSFVAFGLLVYCVIQFFSTDALEDKLMWLGGALMAVIATSSLKIWFWMEMNRAATARDLERIRLQLSLIGQKLER